MRRVVTTHMMLGAVLVAVSLWILFGFTFSTDDRTWLDPARAVVGVIVATWVLTNREWLRGSGVFPMLFMFWIVAVTALSGRLSLGILFASASALAVFGLASTAGRSWGVFRAGLFVFALGTITLNAFSLASPELDLNGHQLYFVGGKNAFAMAFIPLIFLLHVTWQPTSPAGRVARVVACAVAAGSTVYAGSGTGVVMVALYAAFILTRGRLLKRWVPWFLSIPLIHLSLQSGWLINNSEWARELVSGGLDKSLTFTNRTRIWDLSWQRVGEHPLGEGRGYSFLGDYLEGISESHNLFLEALLTGGWPALVLLLVVIGTIMRRASSIAGGAGVYFVWMAGVVGAMESYTFHFGFWLLLGLAAARPQPRPDGEAEEDVRSQEIALRGRALR